MVLVSLGCPAPMDQITGFLVYKGPLSPSLGFGMNPLSLYTSLV